MYYRFTVEGFGQFPIDMLRFDECYPASEADSYLITQQRGRREITLETCRDRVGWEPTKGRWNSFLWAASDPRSI